MAIGNFQSFFSSFFNRKPYLDWSPCRRICLVFSHVKAAHLRHRKKKSLSHKFNCIAWNDRTSALLCRQTLQISSPVMTCTKVYTSGSQQVDRKFLRGVPEALPGSGGKGHGILISSWRRRQQESPKIGQYSLDLYSAITKNRVELSLKTLCLYCVGLRMSYTQISKSLKVQI